jgi:hypothetical protein
MILKFDREKEKQYNKLIKLGDNFSHLKETQAKIILLRIEDLEIVIFL